MKWTDSDSPRSRWITSSCACLNRRWEEVWKVKLHCTAILGFLLGGVAGGLGYQRFQEMALLFNVSILFTLGVLHTRE